jgi:hypothetical protein
MESVNINTVWATIKTFFQNLTPVQTAVLGGVLLLLLIILPLSGRLRRKRRLRIYAPVIVLESFQISPLGRDAFFKIRNNGEIATLTSLFIRGRRDIVFKNSFVGHELHRDKSYSILMEATANQKIEENFSIELNYLDKVGNVYKQAFELTSKTAKTARLVKAR